MVFIFTAMQTQLLPLTVHAFNYLT